MLRAAGNDAIASNIMRLTCPQCQTEYEVPDAALAGRARTLRCADCGTKWQAPALPVVEQVEAELPPAATISEIEPVTNAEVDVAEDGSEGPEAPEAIEPAIAETSKAEVIYIPSPPAPLSAARTSFIPPKPVQPPPAAPKPNRGLGISIVLVVLVIAIILAEHRAIAHAWPPSLRLFSALGLH